MIGVIGFLLFMVGAGGMDSQNLIIPAVMAIGGLLMIWLESKKTVRRRPKHSHRQRVRNYKM